MRTVLYATVRILPLGSRPTRWGQRTAYRKEASLADFQPSNSPQQAEAISAGRKTTRNYLAGTVLWAFSNLVVQRRRAPWGDRQQATDFCCKITSAQPPRQRDPRHKNLALGGPKFGLAASKNSDTLTAGRKFSGRSQRICHCGSLPVSPSRPFRFMLQVVSSRVKLRSTTRRSPRCWRSTAFTMHRST
jgi:hypothetical protein